MRLNKLRLNDIKYEYKEYSKELYESINRIGFSFPIQVKHIQDIYICEDGHKRLSVLHDLLQQDPHYWRGDEVVVIINNSDDVHSNDCWRGKNIH